MYPPYVSLRVLRRFPAFFFPRFPPFFGLPFFVGLAFLGLPAILKLRSVSRVQQSLQQNDVRDEKLTPIYTLGSDRKSDPNDTFFFECLSPLCESNVLEVSIRFDFDPSINSLAVARASDLDSFVTSSSLLTHCPIFARNHGFQSW